MKTINIIKEKQIHLVMLFTFQIVSDVILNVEWLIWFFHSITVLPATKFNFVLVDSYLLMSFGLIVFPIIINYNCFVCFSHACKISLISWINLVFININWTENWHSNKTNLIQLISLLLFPANLEANDWMK